MFILIFGLIAIILGIGYLIAKTNININFSVVENFLNKFGLIILVVLIFIMYYISYKISYKLYLKKDN